MDTLFIKMCEKAEKIQAGWEPQDWDYVYNPNWIEENWPDAVWCILPEEIADSGVYGPFLDSEGEWEGCRQRPIWLPTQTQLQEMVIKGLRYQDTEHLLRALNEWDTSEEGYEPYSRTVDSMNQLWLAFVEWKLYGKAWNGEEWLRGQQ